MSSPNSMHGDFVALLGNELKTAKSETKEIQLVTLLLDDSSSIASAGHAQAVICGYNFFLETLRAEPADIRVQTLFLNNRQHNANFIKAQDVPFLDRETYQPHGETPLYLRSNEALIGIQREADRLTRLSYTVRTMSFVFTDGEDNQSFTIKASTVADTVAAMLQTGQHIVGAFALGNGRTNFRKVFASMGIPDRWIKVLTERAQIADAMTQVGTSVSHASRSQADFTQTQTGGFSSQPEDDQ